MAKQGGAHPPHPRCPKCGKAMYKTMVKGKAVAKTDPWAYCRNQDCELYGKNQSDQTSADERDSSKPKPKPEQSKGKGADKGKGKGKDKPEQSKGKGKTKGKTKGKPKSSKAKAEKVAKIKKDILSGKYTTAEIIHRNKTSRKTVAKILKQMKQDGEI